MWRDGTLYYTLYSEHKVMTWDGGRPAQLWHQDGCGPSGLVQTGKGTLLVTCYDSNTVVEIDLDGSTVSSVDADREGRPFLGPNDFEKDERGGIYFSASGTYSADAPAEGAVYYRAPSGSIRPVARRLHYPNGLVSVDHGRTLLVAEMLEQRVIAYDVGENGDLSHRRVFTRTDEVAPVPAGKRGPLDGPDGITADDAGRVYIAQNGAGRVVVTDREGALVRTVDVPAPAVTNVAFGESERTLFVTAARDPAHPPYPGEVYRIDLR